MGVGAKRGTFMENVRLVQLILIFGSEKELNLLKVMFSICSIGRTQDARAPKRYVYQ
jgi:hypothetical protein